MFLGTQWWGWAVAIAGAVVIGWLVGMGIKESGKKGGKKKQYTLPPGPPMWPVIGNVDKLLSLTKPRHVAVAELAEIYGPIILLRFGKRNMVFVSSPEIATDILRNQDHLFANRPTEASPKKYMGYGEYHITMGQQGPYHNFFRKLMIDKLLSPGKVQRFQALRAEEQGLIVREAFEASLSSPGAVIDLRFLIDTLTLNVVTRLSFSKKFYGVESKDGKSGPYKEIIREVIQLIPTILAEDGIPSLKWIDVLTGTRKRMQMCYKRADALWQGILDERRRELEALRPKELEGYEAKDFLDMVILMQKKGMFVEHINDWSIKAVVQDLVMAGAETNATLMEWVLTELLRNPDVMKKAQEEVDSVIGTERCVQESDVPRLPYLAAVVKETFRLHEPVPWLLPRYNFQDCKVAGYDIPAKSLININVWAMGRNPTLWEDPLKFNPERFMSGSKCADMDIKGSHPQLSPFGGGRRICPGLAFAQALNHSTIARLIHSFNWSLPTGQSPEDIDMSEVFGLVLGKKIHMHAVPTPRLPLHLYNI